MTRAHLLDRVIGADWPDLSTPAKLAAFEATPFAERIAARSTYEAIRIGASLRVHRKMRQRPGAAGWGGSSVRPMRAVASSVKAIMGQPRDLP